MPYFVQLPVMEIQDWNANPVFRDVNGRIFKEWCEYLARSICSVHRDSELCIGYFLVDISAWVKHGSGKGDWPDLEGLSEVEREENRRGSGGVLLYDLHGCEGRRSSSFDFRGST